MSLISVIIPTLNEALVITPLLKYLYVQSDVHEIIVTDGGSTDDTIQKAARYAKIVRAPQGRGIQMNYGAEVASGDVLWFLHADVFPHPESIHAIKSAIKDPNIAGGGFEYCLYSPGFRFRIAEYLSNRKNRLLKWLFGDMGIFVRKSIFDIMHGYKEIPLMEDMEFGIRLRKYGRIIILPQKMRTSPRRWFEDGYWFHAFRSWLFQWIFILGGSPYHMAKWYRFK